MAYKSPTFKAYLPKFVLYTNQIGEYAEGIDLTATSLDE